MGVKPKVKRREATRERKALAAAKVERAIEKELVERLRSGAYGDKPLNVEEGIWKKVLRGLEKEGVAERDVDYDEEEDEDEEELEDEDGVGEVEYVSGDEELEEEELGDLEDWLEGSGASDFEEDDDESDSEEDSEDSAEEEDPKKGKMPLKKAPIDDKKRKRGQAPQKPRKRKPLSFSLQDVRLLIFNRWSTCRNRIRNLPPPGTRIGFLISYITFLLLRREVVC